MGRRPSEAEALLDMQKKPQICLLSDIWKCKKLTDIYAVLQKNVTQVTPWHDKVQFCRYWLV